ncbi:MAG: FAD-dependent oxidoreductase, partial [Proteobacteria bacterium]|nr:FAD-dependent oxidoreductase [Pseudomonadota bacterium]
MFSTVRVVENFEGPKYQVENWDEIADVVVIGSGFAGLTAAIEARSAGAAVIILEKMKARGGNSIISDGGIAAAGTPMQEKAGIKDSPELMYSDMLKAGL